MWKWCWHSAHEKFGIWTGPKTHSDHYFKELCHLKSASLHIFLYILLWNNNTSNNNNNNNSNINNNNNNNNNNKKLYLTLKCIHDLQKY